jgi:hypothetical protein
MPPSLRFSPMPIHTDNSMLIHCGSERVFPERSLRSRTGAMFCTSPQAKEPIHSYVLAGRKVPVVPQAGVESPLPGFGMSDTKHI